MAVAAIVLAVAVAAGAVLLVAWPFLREPVTADDRLDAGSPEEAEWRELVEERDRVLAALKELEFAHRTGKIGDDAYRSQVGPLRRAAATALSRLDRYRSGMTAFETPETPAEPTPPPDEGTPPLPEPVPEPYPPPDEADIPSPAPQE
jgi:hypothetical protein